jgi:hypothetical protein
MNMQSRLTLIAFLSLMLLTPFMAFLAKPQSGGLSLDAVALPSYLPYAVAGLLLATCLFSIVYFFVTKNRT